MAPATSRRHHRRLAGARTLPSGVGNPTVMTVRNKGPPIYNILSAMVTVLQSVKSQNLRAATTYLTGKRIQRVELLLRTTRPTERPALEGTPLRRITDEYQKGETAKFEKRLKILNYRLDYDAIKLVAKARVEHYVYPLLYVLLKHQFEVLRLACTHTLDGDEFRVMSISIASIFRAVDTRKRRLKEIFKSHDLDVDERMGKFAFGMICTHHFYVVHVPNNDDAFKYNHEDLGLQPKANVTGNLVGPTTRENDVVNPDSTIAFSFEGFCDHCQKLIEGTRILCVQYMDNILLHTVDLCSRCSEAKVRRMGIIHTQAHLMIETTRPIHDGEMAVLVPRSKELAQTVKTVFKGSEPKTCYCCGGSVAPPCWVCMICAKDTYFCKICRAKRATAPPKGENKHPLTHPLLWIFDRNPIVEVRSAVSDASLATLETKIAAMETKFEERFLALETRLAAGRQIDADIFAD
ncbi:hypothetical protein DFH08DRAFT_1073779 [Mycena albidolilacea]|uniref:Uncharacterized protein n=1 Tax=Mycena albidolilacea TaxID=1033008 RepID=A0AAD7AN37_9AGAR|nr:hypothetical protein DFH08DRAFT_1073779 [Mycena albidolilacea]